MKRRGGALKRRYGHAGLERARSTPRNPFARKKSMLAASVHLLGGKLLGMGDRARDGVQELRDIEKKVDWLLAHSEPKA